MLVALVFFIVTDISLNNALMEPNDPCEAQQFLYDNITFGQRNSILYSPQIYNIQTDCVLWEKTFNDGRLQRYYFKVECINNSQLLKKHYQDYRCIDRFYFRSTVNRNNDDGIDDFNCESIEAVDVAVQEQVGGIEGNTGEEGILSYLWGVLMRYARVINGNIAGNVGNKCLRRCKRRQVSNDCCDDITNELINSDGN